MSKRNHTYTEIASDRRLWDTYVDPDGHTTDAEWDAGTVEARVKFIAECFGPEVDPHPMGILCNLSDEEILDGPLARQAVAAGYSSLRAAANENGWWGMTVGEVARFLSAPIQI